MDRFDAPRRTKVKADLNTPAGAWDCCPEASVPKLRLIGQQERERLNRCCRVVAAGALDPTLGVLDFRHGLAFVRGRASAGDHGGGYEREKQVGQRIGSVPVQHPRSAAKAALNDCPHERKAKGAHLAAFVSCSALFDGA